MGYGQNLKALLDEKGMTVKEVAIKAGIAPTTLYSIIQRDTAVRFDTALKISNILDIPINSICKDNPYEPGEELPKLPADKERMMINLQKKAYCSDRLLKLMELFDYNEFSTVNKLIADFYILNDTARSDLFEYIKIMKNNHTDSERKKVLGKLKKWASSTVQERLKAHNAELRARIKVFEKALKDTVKNINKVVG